MDMFDEERLQKQVDFIREIDREKFIGRQTYLTGASRKENDAEHAWHMAIMTFLLAEYSNEPIDVLHTIEMLLVHDLVEIDAGDTYAYDEVGKLTQSERETKAADRIFGMLPEDQAKKIRGLWDEFEARLTPESKFAHTMDNFQPLMLNVVTDGRAWSERKIRLSQVLGRNAASSQGSEVLWDYAFENFITPNVKKGRLQDDVTPDVETDVKTDVK